MELRLPSLQNLFISILFLFVVMKLLKIRKRKFPNTKHPPGPWRLPLIGNLHQMIGAPLPYRVLRDMAKKHGPLMSLQLGETSNIVISSPEIAKEVLITNGIVFGQRPYLIGLNIMTYNSRDIAMSPYGSYWRQLKKICTVELLSAKRVQSFRSIREEEVSTLVKAIVSNGGAAPISLTDKIYAISSGITCKAAFGSKYKDQEAYISYIREFAKLSTGLSLPDVFPSVKVLQTITGMKQKFEKLFQQGDGIIQSILDDHKERMMVETNFEREVEEDLVTTLLKLQKNADLEFPLTDTEIKAIIWDIFSAGTETSATAMDWTMAEMTKNPRVLEEAQREVRTVFDRNGRVDETCIHEMRYLDAVIKESFRLHPPFPLSVPRESSEKCVINGYEIPSKTRVLVNTWAMGRDPDYWSEAEMFLPERFLDSTIDLQGTNMEFIPFGAGRRICPGISFALATIVLPLAQLLYHFDWNLPNGKKPEDLDMTEEFGITTRRRDDLMLVPTTYKHKFTF